MKTKLAKLGAAFLVLLLCACGGGGGGGTTTLRVSVTYPSSNVSLYNPTTVTPTYTGFDGHTPICSLQGGAAPTGMTLNSNCTVSGTPVEAGVFNMTIQVQASGVSNSITITQSIGVQGPVAVYIMRSAPRPGDTDNVLPMLFWTPPPGLATSWNYQVLSGTLPTGLTLNATTGAISGTYGAAGQYTAVIRATMTTTYGTYVKDGNFFLLVYP